jgi:hypothetical protein
MRWSHSFSSSYRFQLPISGMLFDLVNHEAHELFRQIAIDVLAGSGGPDIRAGPGELIEFGGNDPRRFGIEPKTTLGGLRDFNSVLVFERRGVRNRKDIRQGVTGLGDARKYDPARPVFGAVLVATACFAPPQIGIANDLTGLRKELRHPWAITSFRDCSE